MGMIETYIHTYLHINVSRLDLLLLQVSLAYASNDVGETINIFCVYLMHQKGNITMSDAKHIQREYIQRKRRLVLFCFVLFIIYFLVTIP